MARMWSVASKNDVDVFCGFIYRSKRNRVREALVFLTRLCGLFGFGLVGLTDRSLRLILQVVE